MLYKQYQEDAIIDFYRIETELQKKTKGKLINIEYHNEYLSDIFDKYSGVDCVQLVKKQVRTIALRIQRNCNFKTFTIRYKRKSGIKTEFTKRCEAIYGDMGYLYPYITIQIYLDTFNNKILSCGIVKTKDLYDYVLNNFDILIRRKCFEGNEFLIIPFEKLKLNVSNFIMFGEDNKK